MTDEERELPVWSKPTSHSRLMAGLFVFVLLLIALDYLIL